MAADLDGMLVHAVTFCILVMVVGSMFNGQEIVEASFGNLEQPEDFGDWIAFIGDLVVGVVLFLWQILTFNFFDFPVFIRVVLTSLCTMVILMWILRRGEGILGAAT